MIKLIKADLSRLAKSKISQIGTFLLFAFMLWMTIYNAFIQAPQWEALGYTQYMDGHYFSLQTALCLFAATVLSMFYGTEYSDGGLRNQLIAGHTRQDIYLANLFTGFVYSAVITVIWALVALIGRFHLSWNMPAAQAVSYVLVILLSTMAISAICTTIGMLIPNKAFTVMLTILTILGLFVWAMVIHGKLSQPEMTNNIVITMDGIQTTEPMPNPEYVTGMERTVLETILQILPTGQSMHVSAGTLPNSVLAMGYSVGVILLFTVPGCIFFCKKDLK